MSYTLIATQDGSLTLFDAGTHQHYHNRAGAYTEALKNYALPSGAIDSVFETGELTLLDACYGLTYNTWTLIDAILARHQALEAPPSLCLNVHIVEYNPELFALSEPLLRQSCYSTLQKLPENKLNEIISFLFSISENLTQSNNLSLAITDEIKLNLFIKTKDLRQAIQVLNANEFDLIFHDPFSPNKMPELWTVELFRYYHRLLKTSGQILTYSLAAAVRAGFLEAGFHLMRSEGLGDKPGGTLAFKELPSPELIEKRHIFPAFTGQEMAYLETRAGIPYRDPTLSDTKCQIETRRQLEQEASSRISGETFRKNQSKSFSKS